MPWHPHFSFDLYAIIGWCIGFGLAFRYIRRPQAQVRTAAAPLPEAPSLILRPGPASIEALPRTHDDLGDLR